MSIVYGQRERLDADYARSLIQGFDKKHREVSKLDQGEQDSDKTKDHVHLRSQAGLDDYYEVSGSSKDGALTQCYLGYASQVGNRPKTQADFHRQSIEVWEVKIDQSAYYQETTNLDRTRPEESWVIRYPLNR